MWPDFGIKKLKLYVKIDWNSSLEQAKFNCCVLKAVHDIFLFFLTEQATSGNTNTCVWSAFVILSLFLSQLKYDEPSFFVCYLAMVIDLALIAQSAQKYLTPLMLVFHVSAPIETNMAIWEMLRVNYCIASKHWQNAVRSGQSLSSRTAATKVITVQREHTRSKLMNWMSHIIASLHSTTKNTVALSSFRDNSVDLFGGRLSLVPSAQIHLHWNSKRTKSPLHFPVYWYAVTKFSIIIDHYLTHAWWWWLSECRAWVRAVARWQLWLPLPANILKHCR